MPPVIRNLASKLNTISLFLYAGNTRRPDVTYLTDAVPGYQGFGAVVDFDELPKDYDWEIHWEQVLVGAPGGSEVRLFDHTGAAPLATSGVISTTGPKTLILPKASLPTGVKMIFIESKVIGPGPVTAASVTGKHTITIAIK